MNSMLIKSNETPSHKIQRNSPRK